MTLTAGADEVVAMRFSEPVSGPFRTPISARLPMQLRPGGKSGTGGAYGIFGQSQLKFWIAFEACYPELKSGSASYLLHVSMPILPSGAGWFRDRGPAS